jgi:DNA-binding NarL/FixJ family response regulator
MEAAIAEDLALLWDGLTRLLTAHDISMAEAVADGTSLLDALIKHRPDVAIVDVRLQPTFTSEGLRAAVEAREQLPGLPALVLSQNVEPLYARDPLSDRVGAIGYLLKDRVMDPSRFVGAVRQVAAGGTVMDPDVIAELLGGRAADKRLGLSHSLTVGPRSAAGPVTTSCAAGSVSSRR